MKTYCRNLTITKSDIYFALNEWADHESGRKNLWRIKEEYESEEALCNEIYHEIVSRTLSFRPIRFYSKTEQLNGKVRTIGIESVKQQIVGYLATNFLSEMLRRRIGCFQMSSISGRGQLLSARTVKKWIRSGDCKYWVHLDIRKCYPSFDRFKIMSVFKKYIGSQDLLYVIETLLSTYRNGLNIGSYFSLKCCQLMLSFAYHHIESLTYEHRSKRRWVISHQLWYADDIYLFGNSKKRMRFCVKSLESYLLESFGLSLKPWKICLISDDEPIDVAGFVVRKNSIAIRPSIFLRARKAFARFETDPSLRNARSVCAYYGWISSTSSSKLRQKLNVSVIMNLARKTISNGEKHDHQ